MIDSYGFIDEQEDKRWELKRELDCPNVYTTSQSAWDKARLLHGAGNSIYEVTDHHIIYVDPKQDYWWHDLMWDEYHWLGTEAQTEIILPLKKTILRIRDYFISKDQPQFYVNFRLGQGVSEYPYYAEGKSFAWATPDRRLEWSKQGRIWMVVKATDNPLLPAIELVHRCT